MGRRPSADRAVSMASSVMRRQGPEVSAPRGAQTSV